MANLCRGGLTKTDRDTQKLRLWLFVFLVIAVIALAAGYLTFGGADMGR
jgi:hypothetical protein